MTKASTETITQSIRGETVAKSLNELTDLNNPNQLTFAIVTISKYENMTHHKKINLIINEKITIS